MFAWCHQAARAFHELQKYRTRYLVHMSSSLALKRADLLPIHLTFTVPEKSMRGSEYFWKISPLHSKKGKFILNHLHTESYSLALLSFPSSTPSRIVGKLCFRVSHTISGVSISISSIVCPILSIWWERYLMGKKKIVQCMWNHKRSLEELILLSMVTMLGANPFKSTAAEMWYPNNGESQPPQ